MTVLRQKCAVFCRNLLIKHEYFRFCYLRIAGTPKKPTDLRQRNKPKNSRICDLRTLKKSLLAQPVLKSLPPPATPSIFFTYSVPLPPLRCPKIFLNITLNRNPSIDTLWKFSLNPKRSVKLNFLLALCDVLKHICVISTV